MKKLIIILITSIFLLSCNSDQDDVSTSGQVAAKVNGKEITLFQVNSILKTIPLNGDTSTQEIANQILEELINQEILKQQAMKMKLDRDPDVLYTMERAKEKILVDAYLSEILQNNTPINPKVVRNYFDENPKLFGERKIFNYTQIVVKAEKENIDTIAEFVGNNYDIDDILSELKLNDLQFRLSSETNGSEKLPAPLIEPIYSLNEGDIGFLRMNDGVLIVELHNAIDEPIDFSRAQLAIENYLRLEKRNDDKEVLLGNFKSEATIEYLGDFAKPNLDN